MRLLTTVVMGGLLLCVGPALADTLCLVASPTQEELAKEAVRKCRPGDSLCGLAAVLVLTGTAAAKPSSGDPPAGRAIPRLSTTDGAPVELAAPGRGSEWCDRASRPSAEAGTVLTARGRLGLGDRRGEPVAALAASLLHHTGQWLPVRSVDGARDSLVGTDFLPRLRHLSIRPMLAAASSWAGW
jgi:hypothetical protein